MSFQDRQHWIQSSRTCLLDDKWPSKIPSREMLWLQRRMISLLIWKFSRTQTIFTLSILRHVWFIYFLFAASSASFWLCPVKIEHNINNLITCFATKATPSWNGTYWDVNCLYFCHTANWNKKGNFWHIKEELNPHTISTEISLNCIYSYHRHLSQTHPSPKWGWVPSKKCLDTSAKL